jgi:2-polyprenyl-3-methyl-5-hydroxy-6-metoxy-1,4-benzoquinol methylase
MGAMVTTYEREASYDKYAIDLDKAYYRRILEEVRRNTPGSGVRRVLDIGCFDGTLVSQLAPEWDTYGIEGHQAASQEANKKGVKTSNADLDKGLPFEAAFFDCVIAAEIIEHVYDTDRFLTEIRRVLKPGGLLVLSTPNIASLTNRLLLLLGKYPRYAEYRAGGAGHIRIYTSYAIRDQIRENGFEVLKFAGCNLPLPMHAKWVPGWLKKFAVAGGDYFPGLAGQVVITARKS